MTTIIDRVDDVLRTNSIVNRLLAEQTECLLLMLGCLLLLQSIVIVGNYLAFRMRLRRSAPIAPWVLWLTHIITWSLVLLPLGLLWFVWCLPPPCDTKRPQFMKRLDYFVQGYFLFLFVGNTLVAILGPNGDLHRGVWRWPSISFVLTRIFVAIFYVTSWIAWWIVKEMVRRETTVCRPTD